MNKKFLSIAIGNILESFDFVLFGFLSSFITSAFFSPNNNTDSLLLVFVIFFISFLARPIGGIIFGYIGDTYGRGASLSLSIIIMSFATFSIAILPRYEIIGPAAAIILMTLRVVQGLCVGGEMTGSIVYSVELFNNKFKESPALFSSLAVATSIAGAILGAITCILFSSSCLNSPIWRLPFLIGSIVGVIGFYIRRSIVEQSNIIKKSTAYFSLFINEWKNILAIMGIGSFVGVVFYGMYVFPNGFLPTVFSLNPIHVMIFTSSGLGFYMIFLPIMGKLADKIGHTVCMITSCAALIIFAYPIILLLMSKNNMNILLAELISSIILALFVAPASYLMVTILPIDIRYSGVSFGYNTGVCIFGGATPSIFLITINNTGNLLSPSVYIVIGGVIGLFSSIYLHKNKNNIQFSVNQSNLISSKNCINKCSIINLVNQDKG